MTNVLSFDFSYYKGVFAFWEDKTKCKVLLHFIATVLRSANVTRSILISLFTFINYLELKVNIAAFDK